MALLGRRLAACKYTEGEEIFEWLAKLDGIYAQFRAAGAEVPDLEKKHRAMGLISEAPVWGSMAHLLGTADGVSYTDWRRLCSGRKKNWSRMDLWRVKSGRMNCMEQGGLLRVRCRRQLYIRLLEGRDSEVGG